MADLKVNDKVVIKKDRVAAVVTQAVSIEGKKQIRVTCERLDNGSVNEYWVDDLDRA